jgi:flagella basal body P-ring formation protein FlgA
MSPFCALVGFALAAALMIVGERPIWAQAGSDAPNAERRPVVIEATSNITVENAKIRVADIASIQADEELAGRIGQIQIGVAPHPAKQKTLLGYKVAEAIWAQAWLPQDSQINLPEVIRVRRSFQMAPVEQLKAFFVECLTAHFGDEDFNLIRFKVRGNKYLPVGPLSFRLSEPVQNEKSHRVSAAVTVYVDNKEAGHLKLMGRINRFVPVVCARRAILKNTVLEASDLTLEMMNVSKLPSNALYALQDAVGMKTKRMIRQGNCLRANLLELAPIVLKGDKVKMVATNGVLNVTTLGVAQEAGGKGEQIRIQNVASGKVVIGKVANASTVTVFF